MQCGSERVFPWRVVNKDDNTPAHVALLNGNVSLAVYLVEKDGSLARVLNHSKETLLHLAIQYHVFETYGPGSDIWPIMELLLQTDSSVTCWEDADGATPLHRATSLKPAYCIPVIRAMLASCPKAAEVHDKGSGQTILHHLTNHQVASYKESLELLSIPQVYALRNIKNHQGDTPLHLTARNHDRNMVDVLLRYSAKIGIKNQSGVSAWTLVRQLEEMRFIERPIEDRRKLTKTKREAAKEGNVAFLNEKLVSLGTHFLVSRTPKGGNILHILMQYREHLIDEAENFIRQAIQKVGEEAGVDARAGVYYPPWKLKNLKGDTPLHIAVRAGNFDAAMKLLEIDDEVTGYVNNRIQTPLHILASCDGNLYSLQ
ncbi:uncharacterized protein LOC141590044 [Silene latifolia]|uniref:uncharacterized protein LOC141590044 n=1 Tax=Silene latifolia TaxID=37657 RepID=UPI003D777577